MNNKKHEKEIKRAHRRARLKVLYREARKVYALANCVIGQYGGLEIVRKIIKKLEELENYKFKEEEGRKCIAASIILKALIACLSVGKQRFVDIEKMQDEELFLDIVEKKFSQETYRQRLEEIAKYEGISEFIDSLISKVLSFAKTKNKQIEIFSKTYITFDIDVSSLLNPKVKKEGVAPTYHGGVEGFSPVFGYMGDVMVGAELKPGNNHSMNGIKEFTDRCLSNGQPLYQSPSQICARLDSGYDSGDYMDYLNSKGVNFIIKVNQRSVDYSKKIDFMMKNCKAVEHKDKDGYTYCIEYFCVDKELTPNTASSNNIYAVCRVMKLFKDSDGNKYSEKDFDINKYSTKGHAPIVYSMLWSNIDFTEYDDQKYNERVGEKLYDVYKAHATSEQYHAELKSEMNLDRLPSKKFSVNALILNIGTIAFNILRFINENALDVDDSFQHHKNKTISRIRQRTVINELIRIPYKLVKHAGVIQIKLTSSTKHLKSLQHLLKICS